MLMAGEEEASGNAMAAAHRIKKAELGAQEVRPRRVRLRLQPSQLVREGRPALLLNILFLRLQKHNLNRTLGRPTAC